MDSYSKKSLPLDLASMEPCHRYVEVIISPTESDIENTLASTEYTEGSVKEKTESSVQQDVELEETSITVDDVVVEGSIESSEVTVKTVDDGQQSQTSDRWRPKSGKSRSVADKRKKQTVTPSPARRDSRVKKAPEPSRRQKREAPEPKRLPPEPSHDVEQPKLPAPEPGDKSPKKDSMHLPSGNWASLRKSIASRKPSVRKSAFLDHTDLPTDIDFAELILVTMFQRKMEKEGSLLDNPFQLDEPEDKSTISTGRDRTSLSQTGTVDTEFKFESPDSLKADSLVEKAGSLKPDSVGGKSDSLKSTLVTQKAKPVKPPFKVDRIFPSTTQKELERREFSPFKSEPKTVEVTIALEESQTVKIVHSKKRREVVTPEKKKQETIQPIPIPQPIAQPILPPTALGKVPTGAPQSKRQKEAVTTSPTEELAIAEASKKEGRRGISKKTKDTTMTKKDTDTFKQDDAIQDSKTLELNVESNEALDDIDNVEYIGSYSKDIDEQTKGLIHTTDSNRRILTIIPTKLRGSGGRPKESHSPEQTEPEQGEPEQGGHEQKEPGEIESTLEIELPDTERKVSVYRKRDSHGATSSTMTYTTESTELFSEETDTSTDYGEPEDVLFYDESMEQPLVHTRIYTKLSETDIKLPPIKLGRKMTKKGTTFKRKNTATLKELLSRRKQVSTEAMMRDVKEGDVAQALVVPSTQAKPHKHFKIRRDPFSHHARESSTRCLNASSEDPRQSINQYLHAKGIHQLFQYLTSKLIVDRPENPLDFLIDIVRVIEQRRQFFLNMYNVYTDDKSADGAFA